MFACVPECNPQLVAVNGQIGLTNRLITYKHTWMYAWQIIGKLSNTHKFMCICVCIYQIRRSQTTERERENGQHNGTRPKCKCNNNISARVLVARAKQTYIHCNEPLFYLSIEIDQSIVVDVILVVVHTFTHTHTQIH